MLSAKVQSEKSYEIQAIHTNYYNWSLKYGLVLTFTLLLCLSLLYFLVN